MRYLSLSRLMLHHHLISDPLGLLSGHEGFSWLDGWRSRSCALSLSFSSSVVWFQSSAVLLEPLWSELWFILHTFRPFISLWVWPLEWFAVHATGEPGVGVPMVKRRAIWTGDAFIQEVEVLAYPNSVGSFQDAASLLRGGFVSLLCHNERSVRLPLISPDLVASWRLVIPSPGSINTRLQRLDVDRSPRVRVLTRRWLMKPGKNVNSQQTRSAVKGINEFGNDGDRRGPFQPVSERESTRRSGPILLSAAFLVHLKL